MENVLSLSQMVFDRIVRTAEPINLEDRYCEMLDENYSSSSFCNDFDLTPSKVLKEVDLTAYDQGLCNFGYSCEDLLEIEGKWYEREEVLRIKAEIIEEIDGILF
jgi:hypothetical protein